MCDNHRSATFTRLRGMSAGANYNLKRKCPSTNVRYSRSTVPKQPFRFWALSSSPPILVGPGQTRTTNSSASWKSPHANNDIRVPSFIPSGALRQPLYRHCSDVAFWRTADRHQCARNFRYPPNCDVHRAIRNVPLTSTPAGSRHVAFAQTPAIRRRPTERVETDPNPSFEYCLGRPPLGSNCSSTNNHTGSGQFLCYVV